MVTTVRGRFLLLRSTPVSGNDDEDAEVEVVEVEVVEMDGAVVCIVSSVALRQYTLYP